SRRAFYQVVFAGNDNEPLAVRCKAETEVAIIGVQRELNFRQLRSLKYSHKLFALVEVAIELLDLHRHRRLLQAHIDRGQDPPWNRQQMRRERDLVCAQMRSRS